MRTRNCWFHKWSDWTMWRMPSSVERNMRRHCVKCGHTKNRIYKQRGPA